MYRLIAAVVALAIASPVLAQEPVGCDKFKWPVEKERALLASAAPIAPGAQIGEPVGRGYKLSLTPIGDARLPNPPTRPPKSDTSAGFINLAAPPTAGTYRVTLSGAGWVDLFQNGRAVTSGAFSSALGCAGIRKSVKFNLSAAPFTVEVTGVPTASISFVVTPD